MTLLTNNKVVTKYPMIPGIDLAGEIVSSQNQQFQAGEPVIVTSYDLGIEAGIVSSAMVIVVSLTAISNFVSPSFNLAISVRLLRFLFIILGGILGLYGIILGFC